MSRGRFFFFSRYSASVATKFLLFSHSEGAKRPKDLDSSPSAQNDHTFSLNLNLDLNLLFYNTQYPLPNTTVGARHPLLFSSKTPAGGNNFTLGTNARCQAPKPQP